MTNADYEPNEPEFECVDCHWGVLESEVWWTEHGDGPLCDDCFMTRTEREKEEGMGYAKSGSSERTEDNTPGQYERSKRTCDLLANEINEMVEHTAPSLIEMFGGLDPGMGLEIEVSVEVIELEAPVVGAGDA